MDTDGHHALQEFRASVGAVWTFLSDSGRTIQKDLAIQGWRGTRLDRTNDVAASVVRRRRTRAWRSAAVLPFVPPASGSRAVP
jgi:hypothetical protein